MGRLAGDQFQYLGSLITYTGNDEREKDKRIGMAETTMVQMSKV